VEKELSEETLPGGIKPVFVRKVEKEKVVYLQMGFASIAELVRARDGILTYPFVQSLHESNIPYTKRYFLDKRLRPYSMVEIERDKNGNIQKIKNSDEPAPPLRTGAFDIETYGKFSRISPEKDPIISIAISCGAGKKVFLHAPYADAITISQPDEKTMLESFLTFTRLADLDILYTYNGDHFDMPFLVERTKKYHIPIDFGHSGIQLIGKGTETSARIHGLQHVDVYQLVRLLVRFQFFKSPRLDLESVMRAVFGEGEKTLTHKGITEIWENQKGFDVLAKYNLTDAEYTQRLGTEFLPLLMELARLVRQPLFEVNRATASQLVEILLMHESVELNQLFPNPPTHDQVEGRLQNPIEGGYVKEPVAGLHTNLAVLDYRSMYPSIMISHNISPDTLDCVHSECKKGANLSPTGHWFCTQRKGLLSVVLERILDQRIEVQKQMDVLPKKDTQQIVLKARKQALKILLNSFFGTLAYPRFRWYSRESASAITAWARHYIHQTLDWAEKDGFTPTYADSDSAFLLLPKPKTEEDVKKFVEKVNKKLPGRMELEFEGLYERGLFVTKKEGKAAKKRYALASYDHELTIVGFEYVRRDVSIIARETQKKVLEEILINGNPKKAHDIVLGVVKRLREGKVPNKELVVLTQLQRRPENYAATAPHVSAAIKAQKRGKEIVVGQMLGFIITKTGKSISDKAELEEFVKEGDYDAEYYIQNQVIPAVEKIFAELGIDSTDLERGGKQTGLGAFV
jgi:DNA polymerase I